MKDVKLELNIDRMDELMEGLREAERFIKYKRKIKKLKSNTLKICIGILHLLCLLNLLLGNTVLALAALLCNLSVLATVYVLFGLEKEGY